MKTSNYSPKIATTEQRQSQLQWKQLVFTKREEKRKHQELLMWTKIRMEEERNVSIFLTRVKCEALVLQMNCK